MRKLELLFMLFFTIYLSCATKEPVVKKEIEEEKKEEAEEVTEVFEPLSLLKDDVVLTPPKWEIKKIDYDALLPSELRQIDSLKISLDEMTPGFRIQIGNFRILEYAIEISEKARSLIEDEVYLDFAAPFYKVRVGDCNSRKDAQALLEGVKRIGFHDAFTIPTMVYKHPELRKQREEERKKAEADTLNIEKQIKRDFQGDAKR